MGGLSALADSPKNKGGQAAHGTREDGKDGLADASGYYQYTTTAGVSILPPPVNPEPVSYI